MLVREQKALRPVPPGIRQEGEQGRFMGHEVPSHKIIKTPEQIQGIRESGKLNVAVLDYVAERIRAGITTAEIDQWVYDYTTKHGGSRLLWL